MATAQTDLPLAMDVPACGPSRGSASERKYTAVEYWQGLAHFYRRVSESAVTLTGHRLKALQDLIDIIDVAQKWAACEEWIDANPTQANDATIIREQRQRRATLLIALWDHRKKQNNQIQRTPLARKDDE